ncbi:MAG TPA: XDD4 family exosortase-dependent surface protein [Myxococcota bacterium]|nr:XDD4 family exosortase-dependent surface protein [Myxococcota bacterium]
MRLKCALALTCALSLPAASSQATVIKSFTGTVPVTLTEVKFEAAMTIAGDTLTITLKNDSQSLAPPASTLNPADLLTSFYFDIFNGTTRPTLTYTSAVGDVCLTDKNAADDCSVVDKGADLRAFVAGDNTWQFKQGIALTLGTDTLTFGIGTAGNNSLGVNGFNGSIVDGLDYGIYAGDITTQNLDGDLLVKELATFTFSGLTGYTEADIVDEAVFGLGTQPDSTGLVPEPATASMLGLGLLALGALRRHRR